MKQADWTSAYEPIPQVLEYRVKHTLAQLAEKPKPAHQWTMRTVVITLALMVVMGSAAYAIIENKTAALLGWFYGKQTQTELEQGDMAVMMQDMRLGDVTYIIEEMVYKKEGSFQGLYGVIRIAPAEDANVVLVAEDYNVHDCAGCLLHYGAGDEEIPDDAPSYAELAAQKGATLLRVRASVNSIASDGKVYPNTIGQSWLPQQDGTVLGIIEITDELPRGNQYDMTLSLSNCEITQDGIELREEPDNTQLSTEWNVAITPTKEGV